MDIWFVSNGEDIVHYEADKFLTPEHCSRHLWMHCNNDLADKGLIFNYNTGVKTIEL